jgi:predicted nucleic acid-binding protein
MTTVGKVVPGAVEVQTLPWIQTQTVGNAQRVITLQVNYDDIALGETEAITLSLELIPNGIRNATHK